MNVKKEVYPTSLGIVLSGGGTRSGYQVGALRALTEVHDVTTPKVIVAASGGAGPALFYLAQRFKEMYDWAALFDDPRFISWMRLRKGPIMDINFLIDGILAAQVPTLAEEIQHSPTQYCVAATQFPSCSPYWFSRESGEPLFEQLRATKTALGICGSLVAIGDRHYADGCFSISIEDCIRKAYDEGAERVILIDNATYGKVPRITRMLLRHSVRHDVPCVRSAVENFCLQETVPIASGSTLCVCRNDDLQTRHGLVRASRYHRATIEQGYADMAKLKIT